MKDVFYAILVIWIIARILNTFSSGNTKTTVNNSGSDKKNSSEQAQPTKKKKFGDDEGEYVDFEEVK